MLECNFTISNMFLWGSFNSLSIHIKNNSIWTAAPAVCSVWKHASYPFTHFLPYFWIHHINGESDLCYINTPLFCTSAFLRVVSLSTAEHCPDNLDRVSAHSQKGVGALIVKRLHNCESEECGGLGTWKYFSCSLEVGAETFTVSSLHQKHCVEDKFFLFLTVSW